MEILVRGTAIWKFQFSKMGLISILYFVVCFWLIACFWFLFVCSFFFACFVFVCFFFFSKQRIYDLQSHCRVPGKEWGFLSWCFEGKSGICLVVYNLHLITMILFYHRNVRMDRKLMFYDAVLTSIFISFVYCWECALSCTWEGMVISRWRTGQFVQGRSFRLNEIVSFTLHYSINWIYTQNCFNAFERFSWCFEGKRGIFLVVYNLHFITMILFYHRNVRMDRKFMFYDAVLTSIFISFVYSTLNV
jgi:hypothetical protein